MLEEEEEEFEGFTGPNGQPCRACRGGSYKSVSGDAACNKSCVQPEHTRIQVDILLHTELLTRMPRA